MTQFYTYQVYCFGYAPEIIYTNKAGQIVQKNCANAIGSVFNPEAYDHVYELSFPHFCANQLPAPPVWSCEYKIVDKQSGKYVSLTREQYIVIVGKLHKIAEYAEIWLKVMPLSTVGGLNFADLECQAFFTCD
jgi:hypothetical protein